MAKKRVFISFDFDNDENLKNLLIGQSYHPDSPLELADWSVKEPMMGNWKAKVRTRIRSVEQVLVLCGKYTDRASGVSAEVSIAQEEGKPYFLLAGNMEGGNKKPTLAKADDKMYNWTWDNLKALIGGAR